MLDQMWKSLMGYLEKQPYWGRLQPVMLILFLYFGASAVVYQYVQWQYGSSSSPAAFLRSFLFKQVTIVLFSAVAVIAAFRLHRPTDDDAVPGVRPWLKRHRGWLVRRLLASVVILVVGAQLWLMVTPSATIANVLLKFDPPQGQMPRLNFDPYRLTYLVYELNREQQAWYFDVSHEPFSEALVPADAPPCANQRIQVLCDAKAYDRSVRAGDRPFILITHQPFGSTATGRSYYWLHQDSTSVISSTDWKFQEPSIYDYLIYSIVVHSILIHLDTQCADFRSPDDDTRTVRGDMFELQSRRALMQASVMAAHLDREIEELLFNCFGPAYAADAARLLSLDWLHDDRVQANLDDILPPKFSSPSLPTPSSTPEGS